MARRVEFLQEAVAELQAPSGPAGGRWRVLRGRAEDRVLVGEVGAVDVVTARAVAPLPRLVNWCRGLLPELEAAGMRNVHARAVGAGLGDAATTVVVMTRGTR